MTIAAITQEWPLAPSPHTVIVTWTGLSSAVGAEPDGQWVSLDGFTLSAISLSGAFGAGGSVSFRGSNGPADESTILGPYSIAGGVSNLSLAALAFRPLVVAGDASTDLTVTAQFLQRV